MDQLAGKEMTIGRFYLRSGDPIAAIAGSAMSSPATRRRSHAPEAPLSPGRGLSDGRLVKEARENGAVLGLQLSRRFWYRDAYNLLTSRGLRPSVTPTGSGASLPHLFFLPHRKSSRPLRRPRGYDRRAGGRPGGRRQAGHDLLRRHRFRARPRPPRRRPQPQPRRSRRRRTTSSRRPGSLIRADSRSSSRPC